LNRRAKIDAQTHQSVTGIDLNPDKPFIARVFLSLWKFINGVRIIVLNVVFFLLLSVFLVVMLETDEPLVVETGSALLIDPQGEVVEQYTGSPLDRALKQAANRNQPETRLRDMVEAIRRAGRDSRISVLVIEPDQIWDIGLASLLELEAAIEDFKSSGKTVIALADNLTQSQYFLASMADEVWLNAEGMLWIDGFSSYRNFYREGLDMLEVEINLFRVGEYKSAMEPFVRNDMSPEAREASLFWISNLWQQYLEAISRNRGIPLEKISDAIAEFPDRLERAGGDFARLAFDLGLVDRLVRRPEANQLLAQMTGPGRGSEGFRQISFQSYLNISGASPRKTNAKNIAILIAEGQIVPGMQPSGLIGAETLTRQIRSLAKNKNVAAVVWRINSPGGVAFSSERIRREIQALRESGKTVVVSMGDVAASGGYWIAMGVDEVWASPSTITGSIGVTGMIPTFAGTLAKLGIHTDGVGTTALAGKLRPDMDMDPDLKRILQASTEQTYRDFISLVAESRNMAEDAVEEIAQGRVWSGSQASERGLIDKTGSLQNAVDSAARIAGLGENYQAYYVESDISGFERFLLDFTADTAVYLNLHSSLSPVFRNGLMDDLLSDLQILARSGGKFSIAAHCFCDIDD
jgi:protease-4